MNAPAGRPPRGHRSRRPQATASQPKKLLFLTHAALYKHTSLGPAEKAVTELGKTGGFEVTTVEGYKQDPKQLDFAFLTPEYLNQFDGVMMMTNGNLPFTDAQKKKLTDFVRGGKALHRRALRVAHLLQLSRVRRDARRLLQSQPAAGHDRGAEGRGHEAPGDEDARRRLAARRRVLPVRHGAVGRGAARREHRRAVQEQDPDGLLARARCTCCSASTPSGWTCRSNRTWFAAAITRRPGRGNTARAAPSTRHSDIATTSGAATRCSARTSTEAFDGRSGSKQ